jgi:hypothetical protein
MYVIGFGRVACAWACLSMSTMKPAATRRVALFCPWIMFHAKPFDMCGVRVMSFVDAEKALGPDDREALWRAPLPYADHFLNDDRTPRPWNKNPLLYAVDPANPLQEPPEQGRQLVGLVNAFLYLCVSAGNRAGPGGMQIYTNASDWALYGHPVGDPDQFSLGARRLLGHLGHAGFRWKYSVISMPPECSRYELFEREIDHSFVAGVTALHQTGRAGLYVGPVRTFMLGTADNHLWRREEDLPWIWGAIEQIADSEGFETCAEGQQQRNASANALGLEPRHSISLIRAVTGPPSPAHAWNGDFRPGRHGGDTPPTSARKQGVQFSVLERALDELNFARNRVVHGGTPPTLEWNVMTLALLGAKFFILLIKRILFWEGARAWSDDDVCEAVGLHAFAQASHGKTLLDGYDAYEHAARECRMTRERERMIAEWERQRETGKAPPDPT